jgi:AraC-like DNA-binding protein
VQAKTGRSARTNPSYERIDQYLERDLTIVEKRDLSVQSKVKAGSLGEQSAGTRWEFSRKSVADIALNSGYSDIGAFRRVFRRIVGLTPSDYRRRFCNSISR